MAKAYKLEGGSERKSMVAYSGEGANFVVHAWPT